MAVGELDLGLRDGGPVAGTGGRILAIAPLPDTRFFFLG